MRVLVTAAFVVLAMISSVRAGLSVQREHNIVTVRGDHFVLTFDMNRGGEIGDLRLHDGARWNSVFTPATPAITFPKLELSDPRGHYALSNDRHAELVDLKSSPEKIALKIRATPHTTELKPSGWRVTLTYEVFPEGAVFCDLDC